MRWMRGPSRRITVRLWRRARFEGSARYPWLGSCSAGRASTPRSLTSRSAGCLPRPLRSTRRSDREVSRWPGAVVAIAIGSYLVDQLLSGRAGPGQTAVLVSVYTLAAHGAPRVSLAAAAVAAGAVIVGQSAHGTPHRYAIAAGVLEVLAAAMLGWLIAERCREQERERQRLAESAATEERVRIARELHDVVAHHLSVIVVQANVLADSSGGDHRAEAISARAIVDSGRRALADMRRILGVLRADQDDSGRSRAPQ